MAIQGVALKHRMVEERHESWRRALVEESNLSCVVGGSYLNHSHNSNFIDNFQDG
jgi:hypothetical protein